MMKLFIKKNKIEIMLALALLIIGTICVILSGKTIIKIITYLMGAFFIISGITVIVGTIKNKSVVTTSLTIPIVQGVVLIILGSSLYIFPNHLVRLIVGILFIIIPTIKIILENEKIMVFKKELYKYIIGLIFIISFDRLLDILFIIIGVALIGLSIVLIIYTIKSFKKDQKNSLLYKLFMKKILDEAQ